MISNRRTLLVVVLAALLAAGAGLYATGTVGGRSHQPEVKRSPTPVPFNKPFIINLADTDADYFIKLQLAVQLEPMAPKELEEFATGGQGEAAEEEKTGPYLVASYPPFHDAVIEVTSRFTSAQLLSPAGKQQLKKELLERFEQIAEDDTPAGAKGWKHSVATPPYHVAAVDFQEYAIQAP